MNKSSIVIIFLCIAVCLAILIYQNRKHRRMMERLQRMLEAAEEGTFSEYSFDESLCSSLENEMAEYLNSSEKSMKTVIAEKDKIKTLIGDISHQTKTPISNLLLYLELIKEEELSPAVRESLNYMQFQAEKLSFLINSLVKLSRLETGIVSLKPKAQDIKEMLQDVINCYREKAEVKNISLCDHSENCIALYDRKWTAEAVGNILDNAIKYTEQGKIEIRTKQYELFTVVEIEDTGIGLSEDEIPRIFSRFYRGEEVSEKEGVGIGLYLAREILSCEGGYIKVTSEKGKGSVFAMYLPSAR